MRPQIWWGSTEWNQWIPLQNVSITTVFGIWHLYWDNSYRSLPIGLQLYTNLTHQQNDWVRGPAFREHFWEPPEEDSSTLVGGGSEVNLVAVYCNSTDNHLRLPTIHVTGWNILLGSLCLSFWNWAFGRFLERSKNHYSMPTCRPSCWPWLFDKRRQMVGTEKPKLFTRQQNYRFKTALNFKTLTAYYKSVIIIFGILLFFD